MQLVDRSSIRQLELSADIVGSLSGARPDSRTTVSSGALLELLVAAHLAGSASSGVVPGCPIRLCHLTWYTQPSSALNARLIWREAGGLSLVCLKLLDREELLVSAGVVAAQALAPSRAAHASEVGERVTSELPLDAEPGFVLGPRALEKVFELAFGYASRLRERFMRAPLSPCPVIELVQVNASGIPRAVVLTARSSPEAGPQIDASLLDAQGNELALLLGVSFTGHTHVPLREREGQLRIFEHVVRACLPATELEPNTALPALGASSIDLVRIGSHAQEWLGWTPTLAEFLAAPSIAGLVDAYSNRQGSTSSLAQRATTTLSATERQLCFLERLSNAAGAYNEGVAWHLHGPLSIDVLERALALLERRHPALRSYFPVHDGVPERKLALDSPGLERIDTPYSARTAPALAREQVEDQITRRFDLEHAPPFRCVLLRHAPDEATLVIAAHHIACDAWSLARVLVPELSAAYRLQLEAANADRESAAANPSESAGELERREPDAAYRRRAEAHFRDTLGPLPHLLDFPFDHPRPAMQTHRGACLHRSLSTRWAAIEALARDLAQSPFVVGLAAYEILLQRYTRMDAFCVGVPVSLRREIRDTDAIGCWVNVSVLRARLDAAATFGEHCERVKAELIEMLRCDELALGDIVRAVSPARSLSHTPLIQAVFGYRELGSARLELAGTSASPLFVHNRCAKFDLTLAIDVRDDGAELSLEYATDLLEPETAARIVDHYEVLLDEVIRRPNERIASLQLAGPSERQLLAELEQGSVRPIIARELGLALLDPERDPTIVLRTHAQTWSGGELRALTQQIVVALRRWRVQPGEFVVVCVPRSVEWVAAVLAILEVGAAYVPLDPRQPRARIRHGIAHSKARVVLVLDRAFAREPGDPLEILELRELALERNRNHEGRAMRTPVPEFDPSRQPGYAILTSGSTGLPRLAAVSHAGLHNLLAFYLEAVSLTAADRVLFATSVGFDLTQKNVFAALISGAELVIDDAESFDPERLTDLIERNQITVFNCTPTLAYALVASAAARDLRKLRSLRVLVLGGEPIDWALLRSWLDDPSCSTRILNSYGPTECSDVVSACVVYDQRMRRAGNNLGRPIPNARCRVVDSGGTLAALDVPGELWLSGAPLGLGYVGDPAATATKFVGDEDARWYRTGDLVRWSAEGELQYLGRIDSQVKVRGHRVELAEIEAALEKQLEVVACAVVNRLDSHERLVLVGYFVPTAADGGKHPGLAAALRRRLSGVLPSYMLPHSLVAVDRLPQTPSGKLDRNALSTLPWAPEPAADSGETSADPLLARVSAAFGRVLGRVDLPSRADFFECGGHSLAAVELVALLEAELGVRLPVSVVFERPILGDFVAFVAEGIAERPDCGGQYSRPPAST